MYVARMSLFRKLAKLFWEVIFPFEVVWNDSKRLDA
jgi:hypothetical protein